MVEYTISQDRAAGNSAQEESGYRLLAGRNVGSDAQKLQALEEQELRKTRDELLFIKRRQAREKMSDPSQAWLSARNSAQSRGGRKRDYVEFEEVNSEPERGSHPGGEESKVDHRDKLTDYQISRPDIEANKLNKRLRQSHQAIEDSEPRQTTKVLDFIADQSHIESPEIGSCGGSGKEIKQKEEHEDAKADEKASTARNTGRPATYGNCILYRVVCSDKSPHCHLRTYLDEPRPVAIRGVYHLIGDSLVPDLIDFLQGRQEIAFVVYRDYVCEKGIRSSLCGLSKNEPVNKYNREVLSIVAEDLQAIIQLRSKFAPNQDAYNFDRYGSGSDDIDDISSALSFAPSEYSHIFLYHHREELSAEAVKVIEESPIMALSSYMAQQPNNIYKKCDHLFSQGLVSNDTLPWLFRPNETLVATKGCLETAYVLRQFPKGTSRLELNCWNWGYDGHSFRRMDTNISVDVPTYGTIRINEMAIYPLRFATEETKSRLLHNGKQFWDLRHHTFVSYEGPDFKGERIYLSDSRCMLDYQVYQKFHPNSEAFAFSSKRRTTYDQWPETVSNSASMQPLEMMLLPPSIHGFFMKEKKWVHLLVAHVQAVDWNKTAFDRLVLPRKTKDLIKALVMVRKLIAQNSELKIGTKTTRDDIIAGKGSGLIMLLHGGPGTGKTLTAESVAELAEMPLYSVTCGDIGTSPEAVEKYLNSVLHLGKKWNCVLLLDEADVFLEERSLQDLERNSLVSVFLRTLEYYDGVLILTSNRVGTFDEAFRSRIHLALQYPSLDVPSRRKIWRNFLDILRDDNENFDEDDIVDHMDELASYEMNGRQIRNALTTARQCALFEQKTLDWDRIKDSIEVAGDFNKYLIEVHGHTEEQRSRENNIR